MLPPFPTGAKISFVISFCDLVDGVRKSILNGSFFSFCLDLLRLVSAFASAGFIQRSAGGISIS